MLQKTWKWPRRPNLTKWGSNNTPPDGQLFLKVELFWGRNPLKAKRIFEGKWIFWKLKLFYKGKHPWICHMGCCLQRENLPPTDLFTSKRFYQHKISTFRNNCPSGGVLLDPNFVKLGRRVQLMKICRILNIQIILSSWKINSKNSIMTTLVQE